LAGDDVGAVLERKIDLRQLGYSQMSWRQVPPRVPPGVNQTPMMSHWQVPAHGFQQLPNVAQIS
jgi:hypothetical protein